MRGFRSLDTYYTGWRVLELGRGAASALILLFLLNIPVYLLFKYMGGLGK